MKKSVLALAVLGAFAGAASAQSSVTLFGVVDLNLMSLTTTSYLLDGHDGMSSSRLGFRGVEDLGGGLKASFWLEGALGPDTGRDARFRQRCSPPAETLVFKRRSTVSLSNQWGELRLGRDYTATFWNWTVFDPFGTNGVGAATNLAFGQDLSPRWPAPYATLVRANNVVQYILPDGVFGPGLYGQVQVAAGEGAAGQQVLGRPYRLRRRSVRRGCRLWRHRLLDRRHHGSDQLEHWWFVELRFHEVVGLLQPDPRRRPG